LATQKSPENKSGLRNVLLVVLALFFLMLMTTGIAYIVARSIAGSNVRTVETAKNQVTYNAGEFLTNLADRGYVKLSMVYLLNDKQAEKEIEFKDSEIRDKVFTILRSKNYESVRDSNGMEELRKEIKESLNQLLNSGRIIDVFFTSIIVN